ncbi:hypothetical protein D3C75_1032470 [compost metagenome]
MANLGFPSSETANFNLVQRTQLVRQINLAATDLGANSSEVRSVREGRFDNQPEGIVRSIRNYLNFIIVVCFVQIREDSNCFLLVIEVDGVVKNTINIIDYLFVIETSHETTPIRFQSL